MPRLRQINCQIEWPKTGLKFEEYGTVYGDGLVETFIAVPTTPQPFSIHLTSKGYVAEGLAMLVYIDGEYQCNRNRLHLKPPKKGQARDQTDVDFRLRQKEKTIGGGTFIGRDWRFDCHNIVPNGQFPGEFDPSHFDQLGMIEVIVLRCRARSGDDSGSESWTHESILGEIDNLGQGLEDPSAVDAGAENHYPAVTDTPEDLDEPSGLAALPGNYGNDGAADDVAPHQFGLDGEAPPPGYWTYHPQHPPPRNGYGTENRPERRVHFDYGSPRTPYYHTRAQSQPHSGPISGADRTGIASNGPSNWDGRGPAEYGGGGLPAWHGIAHRAPTNAEKGGAGWGWHMSNEAPHSYGEPVAHEYSDYDDTQPYIAPPKPAAPHQARWMGPGYAASAHSGWNPTSSATFPVFTPQPQFPAGASYPTNPVGYPPFYAPPHGFQGPGYMMNYPVPAGGWPSNQGGRTGSLDPAKDENNQAQQNVSGNQTQNDGWGTNDGNNNNTNNSNNNDAAANHTTAGAWDQGGDANDANNDNNNNNSGVQQSGNDANANNDWSDPQPGNNDNSDTQGNWDGHGNDNGNNVQNNTETQGNWDHNANDTQNNNNQTPGNWDSSDNNQPQQAQDSWNDNVQSAPAIATGLRSTRPLYGPYGAYYSSHARARHTTDGLSPAAEAEEEPPFDVPESVVADRGTTHQVQPGRGYMYVHKRASPEYVDGIEEPYARFVFKYRTKEQIEREIGITINCEPSGDEEKERKRQYTDKTQELIELLLRAQSALGGKIPSPPPPPPPPPPLPPPPPPPAVPAGAEGGADEDKSFHPAPVPAPTGYKYLKYELPKGRNPSLGFSGGGGGNGGGGGGGGGDWNMSSSGPAGGWGAPASAPAPTPSGQQGASNWRTAAGGGNQNGNQNQNQNQWGGGWGGGNSTGQNANANANAHANASKHSSPGDGGWGPAAWAGGLQEAAAPAGGAW